MSAASLVMFGCDGESPSPKAIPPVPGGMGVGFNEDPSARSFVLQSKLGMPLIRFKVPWNLVEPAPGRWDWRAFDLQYRAMLAAGLKPILLAIGGPCWTRLGRPCAPGVPDPSFDSSWGEYVRRLTERYPAAVGVEVWNEENITPMFPPHPDPGRFAALLKGAHDAVKSVDPRLPVILGGLFASDRSGGYALADSDFLAAVLAAGAGDWIDAIGAHPYPRIGGYGGPVRYDLAGMQQALDRLRAARDAAGFSEIPFWITEMGVSTASAPGFPHGAIQAQQKQLLIGALRDARRDGDVQVALIHRLIDTPTSSSSSRLGLIESGFGVYAVDGRPKAAACALSAEFRGSLRC